MTPTWFAANWPQIKSWVESQYPHEGCGLVTERGRWIACDNTADSPRTSYVIDPMRVLELETTGEALCVIVHSHVDADAYFSDEDIAGATFPGTKSPAFPGVDYLVVSVKHKKADQAKLFRFAEVGEFECVFEFDFLN